MQWIRILNKFIKCNELECLNSSVVPLFSMVKNPSSVFAFNWIFLFMFLFWISNTILYGESSSVKLSAEIW